MAMTPRDVFLQHKYKRVPLSKAAGHISAAVERANASGIRSGSNATESTGGRVPRGANSASRAPLVIAAVAVRRRRETKLDLRRAEAREQRELAQVSDLEAQRQSAEAEERAARAKREQLASQQQQLAAARSRATVDDLRSRADEVDPDVESR